MTFLSVLFAAALTTVTADPSAAPFQQLSGSLAPVGVRNPKTDKPPKTHLVEDLTKVVSPYEQLRKLALSKGVSTGKEKRRICAVAPKKLPGNPKVGPVRFNPVLWQAHWVLSAFASGFADAIVFDAPLKDEGLARVVRNLGLALRDHPLILRHGELSSSGAEEKTDRSPLDEEESDDSLTVDSEPQACANYAARRSGDVEYLVLANASRTEICVVAVNSTAEARRLAVDLKGFRALDGICRGIAFGASGKPVFSGLGFYSLPVRPFTADLEPESVSTCTFPISK